MQKALPLLTAILVSAGGLASCDKPEGAKSADTAGAPADNSTAASLASRVGGQFIPLLSCNAFQEVIDDNDGSTNTVALSAPVHQFEIEVRKPDLEDVTRLVKKNGQPVPGLSVGSNGKKPTKWDFDADLRTPTTTGTTTTYQRATITIRLNPNGSRDFKFPEERFVIRAGDPEGFAMFCDARRIDDHTAAVDVVHLPGASIGSFNVGVVFSDKDGTHEMPVYFDPEVKNDG